MENFVFPDEMKRPKGAYIKYARRPGGRGGHPNACRLVHGGRGVTALRAQAQKDQK